MNVCRLLALAITATVLHTAPTRAEVYNAQAGPNVWGPELQVKGHVGSVTYTISYEALGKTSVVGEVTFVAEDGRTVPRQFNGSITFKTGNAVGAPVLRFKGAPFGSAVRVTVSP